MGLIFKFTLPHCDQVRFQKQGRLHMQNFVLKRVSKLFLRRECKKYKRDN